MEICDLKILEFFIHLERSTDGKLKEWRDVKVSDIVLLDQAETDMQIGAFKEQSVVLVVTATKIEVDVVMSLEQQDMTCSLKDREKSWDLAGKGQLF